MADRYRHERDPDRRDEEGGDFNDGREGNWGRQGDSSRTMDGDWYRQAYGRQGDSQREAERGRRRWESERRAPEDWMRHTEEGRDERRSGRGEEWREQRGQGDWGERGSAWDQGRSEWPRESRPEWGRGERGESWARGREEWRARQPHRRDFGDRTNVGGYGWGAPGVSTGERQPGYGREDFGSYDRVEGREGGFGRYSNFGGQSGYGGGASSFGYGGGMTGYGSERGMGYSGEFTRYGDRGGFAGKGPKGYRRSDERIREEINERLTDHPDIDATEVDVQVQNGEVTLSGTVDHRYAKRLSEELAEEVSGVREVRNEIRVQRQEIKEQPHRG